ncbi:hypothetical protein [Chryseobacterium carnipullorum]
MTKISLFCYLTIKVYNFEVEGNHNYYVSEKEDGKTWNVYGICCKY